MKGYIDVHNHAIPKDYTDTLAKMGVKKGLGVQFPAWTEKDALEVMDENGVQTQVLSISAPGVWFRDADPTFRYAKELSRSTNEFLAALLRKYPTRFGAFATTPMPDVESAILEVAYALDELCLDGVVLLSNYDGYYLGDERYDRLFAELDRRSAVVFIHPASPPDFESSHLGLPEAMVDVCFDTTRTVFSLIIGGVIKRYPNIRFILAHAGGATPYMAGRVGFVSQLAADLKGVAPHIADGIGAMGKVIPALKDHMPGTLNYYLNLRKNVFPEGIDYFLSRFYYDTALSASPHAFTSLLTLVDTAHILFGTDSAFAGKAAVHPSITGVESYQAFSEQDVGNIRNGSALAIFPRLAEACAA